MATENTKNHMSQVTFDFLFDMAYDAYDRCREFVEKAISVPNDGDHRHLLEYHGYRQEAEHAFGLCEGICAALDKVRGFSWDDDENTALDMVRDKYERTY